MKTLVFSLILLAHALLAHPVLAQAKQLTAAQHEQALDQHRAAYVANLLLDPRSPLGQGDGSGVKFYATDSSLRVATVVLPIPNPKALNIVTSDGRAKPYRPYAKLFFYVGDSLQQLTAYERIGMPAPLFLPFADASNGEDTYGGGRYLELDRAAVDSRQLLLDFNLAYNPYCAYGAGFSCPLPPPANQLSIAIRAGELIYQDAH